MSKIARVRGRAVTSRCLWLFLAASGCAGDEGAGNAEKANMPVSDAAAPGFDATAELVATEDDGGSDEPESDAAAPHDSGTSPEISLADPPDGWVQTPERCGVRLWGPPDIIEIAAQGIDSCVLRFQTSSCNFRGDVGGFSGPVTQHEGELDFQVSEVRVDGREGELAQFRFREGGSHPYAAALRVALPDGWNLAASLSATCSSAEARDEALLALRTATIQPPADD